MEQHCVLERSLDAVGLGDRGGRKWFDHRRRRGRWETI
ncbi:hypothetical protein DB30_06970 [Enhygromyxa salina]|uniref:Uncharacterized protein n=1 Tax=Enhygromyxa salina TaxID=215803 RepID=A0A0C2CST1_9BACT|nr:hypothetical protein DB30_06970 [Enhygromyxa salina]